MSSTPRPVLSAPAQRLPMPRLPLSAYALFAAPLMMTALPLAILLPSFYAARTGLALATIGAILLATRLIDAIADPLLGAWVDVLRSQGRLLMPIMLGAGLLAVSFTALLLPPTGLAGAAAGGWLALMLAGAYLGYSLAIVAYQAWGAGLAHDDVGRARVTAVREGVGLLGVLAGGSLPALAGNVSLVVLFVVLLVVALALIAVRAPRPDRRVASGAVPPIITAPATAPWRAFVAPLRHRSARWLLAVFAVNALAPALTATVFPFFVADRLQHPEALPLFLSLYFAAGAASMPLWVRLARRTSLQAAWLVGMLAAIVAFVGTARLGAGDGTAFAVICVLAGAAGGADLALPPALLARVIEANGDGSRREGTYFGLWNLVNKLCLAGAGGIALPLLQGLGYSPAAREAAALEALAFTYAVVPCLLKLAAAALLAHAWRRARF
jgi:Na+/melibiose symporter-like transporter